MIPTVMKLEEEDDEESVGSLRSRPLAFLQEPGWLSFIISMQDQSALHSSSSLSVCACVQS